MTTSWETLAAALADNALARNVLDAHFRGRGRRQVALLDQVDPARAQVRTLLGLIQRGRKTRFGTDHDFRRIRSLADFHRLVPVRTSAELLRQYGPPTPSETLQSSFRSAFSTALAFAVHARPHARLLSGPVLVLDEVPSSVMGPRALGRLPLPARLYARAACGPDRHGNDDPVSALAEQHARDEVTTLIGPADKLLELGERVKRIRAVERLERAWPGLQVVLWSAGGSGAASRSLRAELPASTLSLELFFHPAGPLAVEEPRYGGLRLLTDHGMFFEFLPAGQGDTRGGPRLGLNEVEEGKDYEVALTTPGGLWACRVGLIVTFVRVRPHLVQVKPVMATPSAVSQNGRADGAHPLVAPVGPVVGRHEPRV